jgi:hypothetical protein
MRGIDYEHLQQLIQRYEPTGQAPAGISPQGAGNEPKEIQQAPFIRIIVHI